MSKRLTQGFHFILLGLFLICTRIEANQSAIQHGAQIFINYCSGCHSLQYFRYNFTDKHTSVPLMSNVTLTSMPPEDARQWFGMVPPDLSLIARQRSPAWLYTFLQSFYADSHRPFGTNNLLVPDINMPNALEPLQKEMSKEEFDHTLKDLVTYLVYVAEPKKQLRIRIGYGVILFLCIFVVVVYQLKNIYWQKKKL